MAELIKVWERESEIPISYVDFEGKLRLDSIFNIMQNEALNHSEKIGVGFKKFLKDNQIWVLTWAKIKIDKYPKFEERIMLKTWLREQYRLFTIRDFLFSDESGHISVRASTGWLLLNAKTKRPERPKDLPKTVKFLSDKKALEDYPRKLKDFEYHGGKNSRKKIQYTDLDLNNHTNNSRYIEFVLNSVFAENLKKKEISTFELFFFSDSKFSEEIECFLKNQEKLTNILIINNTKNIKILRADIEWNFLQ